MADATKSDQFQRDKSVGIDPISLLIITTLMIIIIIIISSSSSSSTCWGDRLQVLRRFKWDRNEIWQNFCSSKYASVDAIGFLT